MTVAAVVGLQWGDEGKGKIVDMLAAEARHVARFQGGHNAGHTLVAGGKKTALHLLPSGILRRRARCYIGGGVVVPPDSLLEEIAGLPNPGALRGRLFVSSSAALVLPYHVLMDRQNESGKNGIGTTLRGIGPAHEDKTARRALRIYDLYNGAGRKKLAANAALYAARLQTKINPDAVWTRLQKQAAQLRPYVCADVGERLAAAKRRGENIVLEGAQGVMLDVEQGTYPFTTSAQCLPAAAAGGIGAELAPQILGVCKAYATRVGNGPFPTELHNGAGAKIAADGEEFGATTGRPRRCGWLDIPMLRHAVLVSGCKRIALTKLDVLDGLDEIPLCTGYVLDGKTVLTPPADPAALSRCRPVYETMPGWGGKKTANVREYSKLPAAARRYLTHIARLLGVRLDVVSTGAARETAVVRRHPLRR